jgi:hypothetical protein
LLRWKIGFIDRLQHQHRGCHADPIPQGRNAQRPELAIGVVCQIISPPISQSISESSTSHFPH